MGKQAAQRVFDAIDPGKDVDGFHPVNVGKLVQGRAHLKPCTPSGVIEMLDRSSLPIGGRHAVVIGRSEIVGKPMAMLLLQRDATVTICHSKTPDLPAVAAQADILVAAIGRPAFVTRDFVKPGADGDRRRDDAGQRSRPGRSRSSAPARRASSRWRSAARSSSATCTRRSRRSRAR